MAADGSTNSMLIKFETRSNRVKGLSFHPKRPWILSSLHTGAIQLWDYRMGSLIDRFEEHDGPVRGVDFHISQPLFCSGGDDCKIKVWNYKLRRCLFTLTDHLDYIRTVQFHKEQPWILSASDDQTIRIWNWQARSCISVLTGHNHFVMSAQFHPREDTVVSASIDQTLRLWDISHLRTKRSQPDSFAANVTQDIFGSNDTRVILDGHDRGVNYAAFHPTMPFIVSGADDRTIRLWRLDDTRTYEIEQFRGHAGNVSCVMFFKDYIVSNSEDKSIRVWDSKIRSAIHVLRRENDRFWVLAVHPDKNLIAAGHDSGMILFKLERERPAMQVVDNMLYWVRDRQLRTYDFDTKVENNPLALQRKPKAPPHTLSYCKEAKSVVFYYAQEDGSYELYNLAGAGGTENTPLRGFYKHAVFFCRDKFAVLDKGRQIILRDIKNDIAQVLQPVHDADAIHWAPGTNNIMLSSNDKLYLYDIATKRVTAEASVSKVRYLVWSPNKKLVACLSENAIVVLRRPKLESVCSLHENGRVKSACFDNDKDILVYTTHNHLKYALLANGDTGTIKTLESPIYLVRLVGDEVTYLNREGKVCTMKIKTAEFRFKMALQQKAMGEVAEIIRQTKIHGQAMVSYLQQKGFSEVAMHFVKDQKVKFQLAVECGDLNIALECAEKLDEEQCWLSLADVAQQYGNVELVSTSLSKVKNSTALQKLSFLNFLLGNDEKMRDYADMQRDDVNLRFQSAMLCGDAEARVKLLEEAGQHTLAYQVAVRNGLDEKAQQLKAAAGKALYASLAKPPPEDDDEETEEQAAARERSEALARERVATLAEKITASHPPKGSLALPAKNFIGSNWPMHQIEESYINKVLRDKAAGIAPPPEYAEDMGGAGWGLDMDEDEEQEDGTASSGGMSGGWGDPEIELDAKDIQESHGKGFVMLKEGKSVAMQWLDSRLAHDHIAAGAFESAMNVLNNQCCVQNFAPLKQYFMQIYTAANGSAQVGPCLPSVPVYLNREVSPYKLPLHGIDIEQMREKMKLGAKATTDGRFEEAVSLFQSVLHMGLLIVVDEKLVPEVDAMVKKAMMYGSAMSLEIARKTEGSDMVRQAEMRAYLTHYNLDPEHLRLVLGVAMSTMWKIKNIKMAEGFARRLCEHNPQAKILQQAKKVIATAETQGDAEKCDYDPRNPFELCVKSWKPMYKGVTEPIYCSYCQAPANPSYKGSGCPICQCATLGMRGTGRLNC